MMAWGFYFSDGHTPDVLAGEIRLDAPAPYVGHATRLYVDNLDRDGSYIRTMIAAYPAGATVYIEGDDARFATLRILRAPELRIGYVEIPIVCLAASPGGLVPGPVSAAFLRGALDAPRDAATDPNLVTLDGAKIHLRIADTDHDVDVQQKLTAASATIRDYLKDRNDPTWTPATVPPWVSSAVLLLLTHLYEHRGDEFGDKQDNDDRVWDAIANLLRRARDPALA